MEETEAVLVYRLQVGRVLAQVHVADKVVRPGIAQRSQFLHLHLPSFAVELDRGVHEHVARDHVVVREAAVAAPSGLGEAVPGTPVRSVLSIRQNPARRVEMQPRPLVVDARVVVDVRQRRVLNPDARPEEVAHLRVAGTCAHVRGLAQRARDDVVLHERAHRVQLHEDARERVAPHPRAFDGVVAVGDVEPDARAEIALGAHAPHDHVLGVGELGPTGFPAEGEALPVVARDLAVGERAPIALAGHADLAVVARADADEDVLAPGLVRWLSAGRCGSRTVVACVDAASVVELGRDAVQRRALAAGADGSALRGGVEVAEGDALDGDVADRAGPATVVRPGGRAACQHRPEAG